MSYMNNEQFQFLFDWLKEFKLVLMYCINKSDLFFIGEKLRKELKFFWWG